MAYEESKDEEENPVEIEVRLRVDGKVVGTAYAYNDEDLQELKSVGNFKKVCEYLLEDNVRAAEEEAKLARSNKEKLAKLIG